MLRKFRKDGAVWDFALVAILLNVFLQVGCCVGSAHAGDGLSGDGLSVDDPSLWCSIDKAGAAASSQSDDGSGHTDDCSDCRQCTGLAAIASVGVERIVLADASADAVSFDPVISPMRSLSVTPYKGRAPPLSLRT